MVKIVSALTVLAVVSRICNALVHPIGIHGRYFIDTVTREPFFIKGVDYQPGGSSGVNDYQDPLSDPNACARDVILFQELGVNTIRVYSINPDLNHDTCMTLLASAGIYLVLDVNSPLEHQHLNRYEPWTTYNEYYLEHVFKVVDQFSGYNNTLGFFAGNEIINDKKSARASPVFVKKLISDMKGYISLHSERFIPVGYSAADDLSYRVSLSKYLECSNEKSIQDSVDFYGVNTYQWCGEQTFYTSGYDVLVADYENYARPVFFSEFGCNEVTPRLFEEIGTMFSNDMIGVFSGGLVYEFSQEPNNYGLVDYDQYGNVQLLQDFESLKNQYTTTELPTGRQIAELYSNEGKIQKLGTQSVPECEDEYVNLEITREVEDSIGEGLITDGVDVKRGQFVILSEEDLFTTFNITNYDGTPYEGSDHVQVETLIDGISEYEASRLSSIESDGE
ncbi:putative secreted protein [Wickerhamomyces ciferrii]|uniref:1,3-beta-glucanosyltransferase n=1 Tax=Wickerhamomyces ciferrii (strain ATCC 14091 / BCRC 22168 / CBS 111 / JCM 3599 / NBRC 0793 / NRRL Y-1031 F-60-10) TaxID=1206466 RepID=K0KX79_WICCF|nr:uncharacterized protein BN7_6242 [Wickerhamomyces ciferrii]CCH46647.1 putative secreted protein [Wickerhamomyces ciferrii]